jgi:RHS repeat-associated protein
VYLDELGRQRWTVVDLGSDYGTEDLIVGKRTYDPVGRVAFEADPYPSSHETSLVYGTSQYFRADGSPWLSIRGFGPQAPSATPDASLERFPTLFEHSFANHAQSTRVQTADALTSGSAQYGVAREEVATAIGRVTTRSTTQNGARLEHAELGYDRLGGLTRMIRFQTPGTASDPVEWRWQFDSVGQVLQLTEPSVAPQQRRYSNWGELLEVTWTPSTPEPTHSIVTEYDALGRTLSTDERNGGVTDPTTVKKFGYDTAVKVSPLVSPTNVLGRLAFATAATGTTQLSYDAFGRVNARTHTTQNNIYVERHGFHGDGSQAWIELNLPDNNYAVERVDYDYDSAGQLRWMWHSDGINTEELFNATQIDPWGRLRKAWFGKRVEYSAGFAERGRRLPIDINLRSGNETRSISYTGFDAVGRETSRSEDIPWLGGFHSYNYDALGRLQSTHKLGMMSPGSAWSFQYDALGNVLNAGELMTNDNVGLSYQTTDRDRICNVTYTGFMPPGCNVDYDSFGNIVFQPTRAGHNKLSYLNSGDPKRIENQSGAVATFRYDAFGQVQELDIIEGTELVRSDRRYGAYLTERYQKTATNKSLYLARQFPGPGMTISQRGAKGPWIYQFAEMRGARFTTDQNGFVQDLEYSPFGATKSQGAQPGTPEFSTEQWNDGDALAQFGLVHLGARLYDPSSGRFLSRDPLLTARTSSTTNPYAFAFSDPTNFSDPSGLDACAYTSTCHIFASYGSDQQSTLSTAATGVAAIIGAILYLGGQPQGADSRTGPRQFTSAELRKMPVVFAYRSATFGDNWGDLSGKPVAWFMFNFESEDIDWANVPEFVKGHFNDLLELPKEICYQSSLPPSEQDPRVFLKTFALYVGGAIPKPAGGMLRSGPVFGGTGRIGLRGLVAGARARATFEGIEVRGMRDMSHVPESTLRAQAQLGFAGRDFRGRPLDLHHHGQNPAGPLIEIVRKNHNVHNRIQHPFGNQRGGGLSPEQRAAHDSLRVRYWKARALGELERRGLL